MAVSQAQGGTRSGLLWEVERILDELNKEREKEGSNYLPILLMENVPEVQGSGNLPFFIQWCNKLESLGYSNYFQILNAKDYGIPQNRRRCYMVSIYGSYAYDFPMKLNLKYKLKDFLETKVDEKYYLSEKDIERISTWNAYEKPLENALDINKEDSKVIQAITTHVGKDSAGMKLIKTNEGLKIKENNEQGYKVANIGDGVNLASRMKHQMGNVQKESIQTLKAQMEVGVVVDDEET